MPCGRRPPSVRADGVLLEILGVHDLHDPQLAPQYGQYGEQYHRRHRSDGGEDEAAGHEFPQREENEYDERYRAERHQKFQAFHNGRLKSEFSCEGRTRRTSGLGSSTGGVR